VLDQSCRLKHAVLDKPILRDLGPRMPAREILAVEQAGKALGWHIQEVALAVPLSHSRVADRDRAVVALDNDRTFGTLRSVPVGAIRPRHLNVLLDHQAVVYHTNESGVADLVSVLIEPWRLKDDVHRLPLPRRPGGVHAGRRSGIDVMIRRFVRGSRVYASAVAACRLLDVSTIEDLDFIIAVEADAGVRSLGDHKLQMDLNVLELLLRDETRRLAGRAVDQDAVSWRANEQARVVRVEGRLARRVPIAVGQTPITEPVLCDDGAIHEKKEKYRYWNAHGNTSYSLRVVLHSPCGQAGDHMP